MLELMVQKNKDDKEIALTENGKLIEYYKDKDDVNRNEGNIYLGIIKDVLKGMQSAFVDIGTEKNSFIHLKDMLPKVDETKEKPNNNIDIKDVVKQGNQILVQVKKDSNEKKGARVSSHISLPSKYVVLMPNTEIITISHKIEKENERKRLLEIMKNNLPENMGVIVRTSAEGKQEKDLADDLKHAINKWKEISKKYGSCSKKEPALIYRSTNIVEKMVIDLCENGLNKIIVNNKKDYKEILNFVKNEELSGIDITLKEGNVLNVYDLESQIEKLHSRKIWLNCGGFITIDKTEALTAIDVNTGKYTGKKNLEDTVYKVNYEATIEIAKQLKLRDIGGIIIIDYIDMKLLENKNKIENLLKESLQKDRAKTQIEGFTKLDLMELTRKHICSHKD